MMQRTKPSLAVTRFLQVFCLLVCIGSLSTAEQSSSPLSLKSPHGRLRLEFQLDRKGSATFKIFQNREQLCRGALGLAFSNGIPLAEGLEVEGANRQSQDQTYMIPVGKTSSARDRHEGLTIRLREQNGARRSLAVEFRVFDDAVAFRYRLPTQRSVDEFALTDELTRFVFNQHDQVRYLPLASYTTSYENYFDSLCVRELASGKLIGLPMLVEHPAARPVWIAVTEASLKDYAGMYLSAVEGEPGAFSAKLSPLPGRSDAAKVLGRTPFSTPWRLLMIAEDPGRLIDSDVVFHLNEPSKIKDTSWINPGKTTFPWWNRYVLGDVDFTPGVNTATVKHYIDFCAKRGIPYHSLDGLEIAWYGGPIAPKGPTDVTTAAPSIDLPEVLRYAKQKGVKLRLWTHCKALKPQLDQALAIYEEWGIEGIMVDFMDRDDQTMVRWYHEVAEKAARHRLTVTWHGAYKPTGMERTWPNVLSYEGVLNQEYNKWSPRGAPPAHNLDAAFLRMLAGPLDYHQGGMRSVLPEQFRPQNAAPSVQGTRGHQLAMYIVYQNHLPMMVDYPAAYRGQSGLEFLIQTPCNWDKSQVLHAEIGKCLIIARRHGDTWWLGGMTADEPRELEVPLKFLDPGEFKSTVYFDNPDGGPISLKQSTLHVTPSDSLLVKMPLGGGFVGRLDRISP